MLYWRTSRDSMGYYMPRQRKKPPETYRNLSISFKAEERRLIAEVAEADLLPVSIWAKRILLRAAWRAQAEQSSADGRSDARRDVVDRA